MATKKTDVTVYIGRFNPFHLGHASVLRQAMQKSKLVIMLVGSSGYARSIKNPFTFKEREQMIQSYLGTNKVSGCEVIIKPLRDYPYNDNRWIEQVQNVVKKTTTAYAISSNQLLLDIALTGSNRDESTWYLSAFPQYKMDLQPEFRLDKDAMVSATSVREVLYADLSVTDGVKLGSKVPPSSVKFLLDFKQTEACRLLRQEQEHNERYKKAWSRAPYAPTFVTTDAVVIQSGHILVVERGAFPGKGLWALPGGFLNQHERLATGAIRELMEETDIKIPKTMLERIIRTAPKEIFDDPYRSQRGRTITTAFLIRLDDTQPLPKVRGMNVPAYEADGQEIVETARAWWVPISEALERTDKWFEDHSHIVETMVNLRADR